jgi:hypothetical protein
MMSEKIFNVIDVIEKLEKENLNSIKRVYEKGEMNADAFSDLLFGYFCSMGLDSDEFLEALVICHRKGVFDFAGKNEGRTLKISALKIILEHCQGIMKIIHLFSDKMESDLCQKEVLVFDCFNKEIKDYLISMTLIVETMLKDLRNNDKD